MIMIRRGIFFFSGRGREEERAGKRGKFLEPGRKYTPPAESLQYRRLGIVKAFLLSNINCQCCRWSSSERVKVSYGCSNIIGRSGLSNKCEQWILPQTWMSPTISTGSDSSKTVMKHVHQWPRPSDVVQHAECWRQSSANSSSCPHEASVHENEIFRKVYSHETRWRQMISGYFAAPSWLEFCRVDAVPYSYTLLRWNKMALKRLCYHSPLGILRISDECGVYSAQTDRQFFASVDV